MILACSGLAGPALAQSALTPEELQAKALEGAQRIAQFQQILQNPDMRVQYEAMRLMLGSKDPALVRIAKEHGLFSTNPVLRNAAIEAIFDAGGLIRLQISSLGEKSAPLMGWIVAMGGAHDGQTGSTILNIGAKNGNCWAQYRDRCMLQLAGTNVEFNWTRTNDHTATAALNLGPDGVLRGKMFYRDATADASIDLKE